MFYIVGITETGKRLAVAASEAKAAEFIETLPDYLDGIYYIDPVRASDGVVKLDA